MYVMISLQDMKECFEKKDVEMLKKVLCAMDPKDVEYHMKRCVDSGLWVDNVNPSETGDEGDSAGQKNADNSVHMDSGEENPIV